jgi:transcriptional regulator GlxA family with amidase domain
MDKRLERPVSCAQLARTVRLSPRQLERLFQRYLDTTPTRYYLEMRLNRARQLLRQTSMPILSVGLACGFVSASHFSKCYRELYNRSPQQERAERKLSMSTARTGVVI